MSYVIFGRAIKNEHLALGTILSACGVAWASMGGGSKQPQAAGSSKAVLEKVKESVPLNAGSSEEEEFIRKFIAEAEKETPSSH